MNDTEIEIEYSKDKDAKIGHKTADTSFWKSVLSAEKQLVRLKITVSAVFPSKQVLHIRNVKRMNLHTHWLIILKRFSLRIRVCL